MSFIHKVYKNLIDHSKDPRVALAALYFFATGNLGLVLASIGPCILILQAQTGASPHEFTFIFTVRSVGYLIGAMVGGWLLDWKPSKGHLILSTALLSTCVATALVPFLSSLILLATMISIQGLAMGLIDTAGNCLLIYVFGEAVGPWMQGMHFCFGLGAVSSPLLIRTSLKAFESYAPAFWLFSALLLISSTGLMCYQTPPPRESAASMGEGSASPTTGTGLTTKIALVAAVSLGLAVGVETSYGGYLLYYAHRELSMSEAMGQYLTSVYWGCMALGRFFAIPLSMLIPAETHLVGDLVVLSFGAVLALAAMHSNTMLWISAVFFGLGIASIFPSVVSMVESYIDVTGRISSVFVIGAATGEMIVPLLTGLLTATYPPAFLWCMAVAIAGSWVGLLGLWRLGSQSEKYTKRKLAHDANKGGKYQGSSTAEAEMTQVSSQSLGEEPSGVQTYSLIRRTEHETRCFGGDDDSRLLLSRRRDEDGVVEFFEHDGDSRDEEENMMVV